MRKIFVFLSLLSALLVLIGCDNREKLYVLNWEEYIDNELVRAFEKENNVKVVLDTATSNESMYNKIKNRAGKYDIVIPSDYMIERMHQEGLLIKLDYSKIPNYDISMFDSKLQELRDNYFQTTRIIPSPISGEAWESCTIRKSGSQGACGNA